MRSLRLALAALPFTFGSILLAACAAAPPPAPVPQETMIPPMPWTSSADVPPAPTTAPATAPTIAPGPGIAVSAPPASGGKTCTSQADCASGETCTGAEGCGVPWTCRKAVACTDDLVQYCGCDGKTFGGSGTCPGRPYAKRGACDGAKSPGAKACKSNGDCASGEMCTGPQGCGVSWSCQPARACTRDLVTFCGCDGKAFKASGSCPTAPYATRGACGTKP